jgi:hypothetical protein
LNQIQEHDEQHEINTLSYDTLQVLYLDLSCKECFPAINYHSSFRRFLLNYNSATSAKSYTQRTVDAYLQLTTGQNYNIVRAAARDLLFSCRYSRILDPSSIIATLLSNHTSYILSSQLPLDFETTTFDLYIETSNYSPRFDNRTVEQLIGEVGSPIPENSSIDLDNFSFTESI